MTVEPTDELAHEQGDKPDSISIRIDEAYRQGKEDADARSRVIKDEWLTPDSSIREELQDRVRQITPRLADLLDALTKDGP